MTGRRPLSTFQALVPHSSHRTSLEPQTCLPGEPTEAGPPLEPEMGTWQVPHNVTLAMGFREGSQAALSDPSQPP